VSVSPKGRSGGMGWSNRVNCHWTDLEQEFKTITMDQGDSSPHEVGIISGMISATDAKIVLNEMKKRSEKVDTRSTDSEDICTSMNSFCVPISLIGEVPPHEKGEAIKNTKVLQFNNQPM
jgi:hypothetical protein